MYLLDYDKFTKNEAQINRWDDGYELVDVALLKNLFRVQFQDVIQISLGIATKAYAEAGFNIDGYVEISQRTLKALRTLDYAVYRAIRPIHGQEEPIIYAMIKYSMFMAIHCVDSVELTAYMANRYLAYNVK